MLTKFPGLATTHCNRLEGRISHRRTGKVTKLFTYLVTHKLFSPCIRRYLVSRACDWVIPALSAVLFTFSFQFSLLFFMLEARQLQRRTWFTQYRTSDVAENVESMFLYAAYSLWERLSIDFNGKMITIHPVEISFGSEIRVICSHCWVIAAWSRKTLKFCEKILRFLKNDPWW